MALATDFRLMRVEVTKEDGPYVDVDLAAAGAIGSWTTLLTGRNGAGKSRLISAIAASFEALDGRHLRDRDDVAISYRMNGLECAFGVHRGRVSAFLDGRPVGQELLPRPGAIVAATASAFDKFNLPRVPRVFGSAPQPPEGSRYKYLGLRDARGRVSSRAGVVRALEQLFDANSDDRRRRRRVAEVFQYLGYKPTVEVIYNWTYRARELAEKDGAVTQTDVARFLDSQRPKTIQSTRSSIPNYVFEDAQAVKNLSSAIGALRNPEEPREIALLADFTDPRPGDEDQLLMARQLTRAGLVQMSEVVLRRETTNDRVEVTDASSGELSLVVTLLGIASSIEDGSLVLIDEPEISLHPQWQADYLRRLGDAFGEFQGCHFVIATHSPTLVSGANPETTSIIDLENTAPGNRTPAVAGSVDEVLLTTFGVVSKSNLYLRELLVAALRGAEDGDLADASFDEIVGTLENARQDLPEADSAGQLIDQLVRMRAGLDGKRQQ